MADRLERDPIIERVVHEMRSVQQPNEAAIARVVAAAVQAREHGVTEEADDVEPPVKRPLRVMRWRVAAGIAAAASVLGFAIGSSMTALRGREVRQPEATRVAAMAPTRAVAAAPGATLVSAAGSEDARVITQFVLARPGASSVTLVGDFNEWDKVTTPLTQEPGSGVWSVALPLTPGRHVYAFLVNGTEWVVDPRAPRASDPDFGVAGSAVIVGRP